MKKRVVSVVITVCLVLTLVLSVPTAGQAISSSVVPDGYIGIYTAEDLKNIENNLSGKYILMNDIRLVEEWEPIGSGSWTSVFSGTFDGNGHSITNMNITNDSAKKTRYGSYAGLFAEIESAYIANICVQGKIIIDAESDSDLRALDAGGIAGISRKSVISNCSNYVDVQYKYGIPSDQVFTAASGIAFTAGGIVGGVSDDDFDDHSTFSQCANYGTISGISDCAPMRIGGIIGDDWCWGLLSISDCYNAGNLSVKTGFCSSEIGGILGQDSISSEMRITNCYNNGVFSMSVGQNSLSKEYIGGIAGNMVNTEKCIVTNCIYRSEDEYANGNTEEILTRVPSHSWQTNINKLYWIMTNVRACSLVEMRQQSTYSGFDFSTVWKMGGRDYMYPILQSNRQIDGSVDTRPTAPRLTLLSQGPFTTSSMFDISWTAVNGASSYTVKVLDSYGKVAHIDSVAYAETPYRLGGLSAGDYTIQVTALTAQNVESAPSNGISVLIASSAKKYSVSYDLNGGTGNTPVTESYEVGARVSVTLVSPTRSGYRFVGWTDGITTYTFGKTFLMPAHDVTLSVVWEKDDSTSSNSQLDYVQALTENSLIHADSDTVESITNALYNLIFKSYYSPTESKIPNSLIPKTNIEFTGTTDRIKEWHPQNYDGVNRNGVTITDQFLNVSLNVPGSAGCMSYAHFASKYVYNTVGSAKSSGGTAGNEDDAIAIQKLFREWVDPGEHIRYTHSSNYHSIIFLGESPDGNGFFYLSYGGGLNSKGTKAYHDLDLNYNSYEDFAQKVAPKFEKEYVLQIQDTNGGSYYKGTAKNIASVRTGDDIDTIVVRIECPVEASIMLENETLDSCNPGSSSFGSVIREGNAIIFALNYEYDYTLSVEGTGDGVMDLTVEYYDTDSKLIDERTFVGYPIDTSTEVRASCFDPQSSFILYGENLFGELIWAAEVGETVYGPSDGYSSAENGPDTPWINPFTDVDTDAYYAEAVTWAVAQGITNGTSSTTFSPNQSCTRGQIVTFLWNAAGKPEPQSSINPFVDVKPSDYYYKAVLWAVKNDITSGTDKSHFSPSKPCTRDQAVTFLWRSEGEPAATQTSTFTDVKAGSFYEDAVNWAVENKITSGTGKNQFSPRQTCTRGQIVTFLYRAKEE